MTQPPWSYDAGKGIRRPNPKVDSSEQRPPGRHTRVPAGPRSERHRVPSVTQAPPTGYPLVAMPRLLLIRHGESEWNALGRWQGQADPPLSDHGRHQAAVAGRRIGSVDMVVASTLQRAASTAAIIADALGIGPVVHDRRLIERDAGEWSGLTRDEIKRAWPGYLAENPDDRHEERRPPGWEGDASLLGRAISAIDDVIADLDDSASVLVVTHGGVIYAIEAHLGASRRYLPNLGARWLDIPKDPGVQAMTLGERIRLHDPETDDDQGDSTPPDAEAV